MLAFGIWSFLGCIATLTEGAVETRKAPFSATLELGGTEAHCSCTEVLLHRSRFCPQNLIASPVGWQVTRDDEVSSEPL